MITSNELVCGINLYKDYLFSNYLALPLKLTTTTMMMMMMMMRMMITPDDDDDNDHNDNNGDNDVDPEEGVADDFVITIALFLLADKIPVKKHNQTLRQLVLISQKEVNIFIKRALTLYETTL